MDIRLRFFSNLQHVLIDYDFELTVWYFQALILRWKVGEDYGYADVFIMAMLTYLLDYGYDDMI